MSNFAVMKFGGTSVSSVARWGIITNVLKEKIKHHKKIIVVCSALSGVSDCLETLGEKAVRNMHRSELKALEDKHRAFAKSLDVSFEHYVQDLFNSLTRLVEGIALTGEFSPTLQARLMAYGELLLTTIAAAYCQAQGLNLGWQDAREWLESIDVESAVGSNHILAAHCDYQPDHELQRKLIQGPADIYLTQGFIAKNKKGTTVLLGRGGSDTSAAYFAAKIEASCCEIWTDVPGIYTTNPHLVPEARLLKHLHYDEAREIASAGAKVLHPKCIEPLQYANIPCYIYCTDHPDWDGTVITSDAPIAQSQVKAIALQRDVTLISMETLGMWQQVGFLSNVFNCFKANGFSVDLVSTSENNVTVSLDQTAKLQSPDQLDNLLADLSRYCQAQLITACASISVLGRQIRSIMHQLAPLFEVFSDHESYMMSQAANDLNLTFVVADNQATKLISKLHTLLFPVQTSDLLLGDAWESHFPVQLDQTPVWWHTHKQAILEAAETGAKYIYHGETLKQAADTLTQLAAVDAIYYSIKANNHPDVLRVFYDAGLGFECVSMNEVEHILNLFPNIDRNRISFTPNFASLEEYRMALPMGVHVTLDNMYVLEQWGKHFSGAQVLLRLDPGQGRGHHKYVQTAGSDSKFGIDPYHISDVVSLTQQHDITVIGLHAHSGSGVMQPTSWQDTAVFLTQLAGHFPDLKIINLGGGLGVPERLGDPSLDLAAVDAAIAKVREAYPQYQFWLEPGRYCVAPAGVLVAKVTQLKTKGPVQYIGVETGMNSLIRPALYGAYHDIINLSNLDAPRTLRANIVGPICESGDTFGYSRAMAPTQEGDVVLITNAGAYGHVMSSQYNLRAPATQMMLG